MDFDDIVVKESPGLCRCCLSEGCYKELVSEYSWMNETEVYADMLLECFDISISQHMEGPNGPNRLICEVCITRLRDACNFKKQVLDSEKKFVDMVGRGEFRPKVVIYQQDMKAENLEVIDDSAIDYLDNDIQYEQNDESMRPEEPHTSGNITAITLPTKARRGRPRKNPDVKIEKKAKKKTVNREFSLGPIRKKQEPEKKPKIVNKSRKDAITKLLAIIIQNSTAMPFRWSNNRYMCFYCPCQFFNSETLKQHTKVEHANAKLKNVLNFLLGHSAIKLDISDFRCKECSRLMNNIEEFLHHIVEHDLLVNYTEDILANIMCFNLSDNGMSCIECHTNFRFFGPLLTHAYRYHNKMKLFLCQDCGEGYVTKEQLGSHIKKHKEKKPKLKMSLKCPRCTEVFPSVYLKKVHLATKHDDIKQFKCDQCDKMFLWQNRLIRHKERVHFKEKRFSCDICGFKVYNKDNLKNHMVKHDDSRPFQCDFCKKSFQRKKTLLLHKRIHADDRRYSCKICGKAFVQTTSLNVHVRVHHSGD